ncbi:MAG: glycosyltransferase family 2 protein [Bacteroidia bacterium]|nr:glycosyltransferase family 2 protein [Bacteroidia bacterium]
MKVSLITVCFNAESVIRTAIESVLAQDYPDIEYIIVDGASSDGTMNIVRSYGNKIHHVISEPDEGLYFAMNKGVARATGDIVGILNADDIYANNQVISRVVKEFQEKKVDMTFADLVYVKADDLSQVVRYYPGKGFVPEKFAKGMMPPHPTYFVRQELYQKAGNFDTRYRICADFDLMVRLFVTHQKTYSYIPGILVHMRVGGNSAWGRNTLQINREMLLSLRSHGVKTNLLKIYSKYFTKIFQLLTKPS